MISEGEVVGSSPITTGRNEGAPRMRRSYSGELRRCLRGRAVPTRPRPLNLSKMASKPRSNRFGMHSLSSLPNAFVNSEKHQSRVASSLAASISTTESPAVSRSVYPKTKSSTRASKVSFSSVAQGIAPCAALHLRQAVRTACTKAPRPRVPDEHIACAEGNRGQRLTPVFC